MEKWIENLKKQLIIDEGVILKVYLDSLGLPTFGIGHLITEKDPEYRADGNYKDVVITKERADEAFEIDVKKHIDECCKLFPNFNYFEDELKEILANMMFNLGFSRFKLFAKTVNAINYGKYLTAAEEMIDSRWFRQVKGRAVRLVKRMANLKLNSL
jgi:lysozyme